MPNSPYGNWLPPDISTHGHGIDRLFNVLHWFMAVLFIGWGIFFVYCLIRFRARPGHEACYHLPKAKASKYSELGVAIFEVFLLFGLAMPVWGSIKNDVPPESSNPLHVHVVAEQFAWNFHYPGADGKMGRTKPELMNASNLIGLDKSDPVAKDDVVTNNNFCMPVDRPIICELTSKDVIHSFFIPVLRVKHDVIPGSRFRLWFQATETGGFQVACAQLCGNNHYNMKADLNIYSKEEFEKWYAGMAGGGGEEEEEE